MISDPLETFFPYFAVMGLLFLHSLESLLDVRLIKTNTKRLDEMSHIICGTGLSTGSYKIVPEQDAMSGGRCSKCGFMIIGGVSGSGSNHEDRNPVLLTSLCLFLLVPMRRSLMDCIGAAASYAVVWFRRTHGLPLEASI